MGLTKQLKAICKEIDERLEANQSYYTTNLTKAQAELLAKKYREQGLEVSEERGMYSVLLGKEESPSGSMFKKLGPGSPQPFAHFGKMSCGKIGGMRYA